MKLNNYPLSRKDNIVVQETGDEVLLYDLNDNKAFCLNETSAAVWELCDGKSSIADINQKLGKKLNVKTDDNLVWLALEQLKKEKLLSNAEDIKIDFNGLSRRDAIKKVGFASLVALPIIMAITSPVAAASLSVCGPTGLNNDALCQCNDTGTVMVGILTVAGCGIAAGGMTSIPAGTVCAPIVGGVNCQNVGGGACQCVSIGVCVGTTQVVSGRCTAV